MAMDPFAFVLQMGLVVPAAWAPRRADLSLVALWACSLHVKFLHDPLTTSAPSSRILLPSFPDTQWKVEVSSLDRLVVARRLVVAVDAPLAAVSGLELRTSPMIRNVTATAAGRPFEFHAMLSSSIAPRPTYAQL